MVLDVLMIKNTLRTNVTQLICLFKIQPKTFIRNLAFFHWLHWIAAISSSNPR